MTKVTHLTLAQDGGLSNRRVHLREIPGDAEAPLETIGQALRAARLRRGEDLATASRVLKIRQDHLAALEEDRLNALPGRTYAVGFVRAYADHLGLNPLQAVERFKSEIAGRDDANKTAGFPEVEEESGLPRGWIVIGVVVLGLIAYGAYYLVASTDSLSKQPVAPVPSRILAKDSALAQPKPVRVAAPPVALSGSGSVVAPSAQAGSSLPGNSSAVAPRPGDNAQMPQAEPGQVYGAQNQNARVVLRVKEPTRLVVQGADGKVFINRALQPGDAYQVPNVPGLLLTVQHGNAIEIDLDGQVMGRAGSGPDVSEALSLDPQAIADRYNYGTSY